MTPYVRPSTVCREDGCPRLSTRAGWCSTHYRTTEQRGYGRAWTRRTARVRAQPCVDCGSTERIQADHPVPRSMGGRDGDEVPRCARCHAANGVRSNANVERLG